MALTAEDLRSIESIVGGMGARLEGRMDGLDGRMDKLDGRMDKLDGRMDGLDGRMDQLYGRMGRVEGSIVRLEGRVDRMESRVLFSISLLQRDGFERLDDHEARIHRLEEIQTH